MATALFCRMFFALLVLTLASCAVFPSGQDMPLAGLNCRQALPSGYEVRATLRVGPGGQDFLLALATAPERNDLALLTVQGIPVYHISCADGGPGTNMQTSAGDMLRPLMLLNYLAMIFMDADVLAQQLQPGWTLQADTAARSFSQPGSSLGVYINYHGKAPWYRVIDLADSLHGVTLDILILESFRVLPE